jgi:uncharacterized membrane protein YgdD (TMEM256/DUF423 family)
MPIEKWASLLVTLAALAGAAGVIEAASAAHQSDAPLLEASSHLLQTSSHFLLLHATAVIAVAGFAHSFPHKSRSMLGAASVLLLGCIVFCGDLSVRALTGSRLFPMAAPLGGSLLILGWLATAVSALLRLRKPSA